MLRLVNGIGSPAVNGSEGFTYENPAVKKLVFNEKFKEQPTFYGLLPDEAYAAGHIGD